MERKVRINQNILQRPGLDRFAAQQIMQNLISTREYNIDGEWTTEKPQKKPLGARVVFDSRQNFRIGLDAYLAWKDINERKQYTPEYPEMILQRFIDARKSGAPLTLFIPWGVRIEGNFGTNEITVMKKIQTIQSQLEERNIPTEVMLMPADLYATEVNNQVGSQQAKDYFDQVSKIGRDQFGFTIKPWSEIRDENMSRYQKKATGLTNDAIRQLLTPQKVKEAIAAAGRRSGYEKQEDIQKAAFAYLRERICEAEIVEDIYQPVKVSVVPKNKDNEVDRNLPRLYLFSSTEQFPWLK